MFLRKTSGLGCGLFQRKRPLPIPEPARILWGQSGNRGHPNTGGSTGAIHHKALGKHPGSGFVNDEGLLARCAGRLVGDADVRPTVKLSNHLVIPKV